MTDKDDAFLDEFFKAARTENPVPSDDLRQRVLDDAAAALTGKQSVLPRAGFWSQFVAMVGGWPAMGGVAAAGVTGLWLGLAPPAAVETLAADFLGNTTSVTFLPGFDDFVEGSVIDG